MKARILLSAVIGAIVAVILYPSIDAMDRVTVFAVSFFLILGILFCTMLIGRQDTTEKEKEQEKAPAAQDDVKESV